MEQTKTIKNRRFIGLRLKVIVGFTLLFSLIFTLAFLWFYNFASQSALDQIEADLKGTLDGALSDIASDEFALLTRVNVPEGQDVPSDYILYQRHQDWLNSIHSIEPNSIPYTFVAGNEPYEVQWIGDIFRIIRPEDATVFRGSYLADPADTMLYQGLTEVTVNMVPYTDKWGTWVSAYGPIRSPSGEVIGGLGIDFRADYVKRVQDAIKLQVLITFLIAFPLQILLVWLLSGVVTSSLNRLTTAAEHIGEGDYDQDLTDLTDRRFPDEMSTLAEVFEIMIAKVRTREQTLRRQVAELKIEIDETKRQEQVSELTESDFFKELTQKARLIRDRRQSGQTSSQPSDEPADPTVAEDDIA
jgi:HAMP domain-containing protein